MVEVVSIGPPAETRPTCGSFGHAGRGLVPRLFHQFGASRPCSATYLRRALVRPHPQGWRSAPAHPFCPNPLVPAGCDASARERDDDFRDFGCFGVKSVKQCATAHHILRCPSKEPVTSLCEVVTFVVFPGVAASWSPQLEFFVSKGVLAIDWLVLVRACCRQLV